jgi:glycosyltransferase involved in cell wall biosynthesis
MQTPLVSIIIPCFNAAAMLAETIESCLNQEHAEIEIIVVDDHSTDGSAEVAAALAQSDSRVYVCTNIRKGQSAARNHGIKQASGEFVKFLDADDCLSPDVIREQVAGLEGRPQALSHCPWAHFVDAPGDRPMKAQATDRHYVSVEGFLAELWTHNMYPPHAWLIPRALLTEDMRWDEALTQNEDGEFFARLIARAQEVRFSKGTAFYRKPVEGHVSQRIGNTHMRSQLNVLRSYRKVCADLGDSLRLLEAYHHQVCGVAYRAATTMEEMSHLPASLALLETTRTGVRFEFPSRAMNVVAHCVGIPHALRFRSWVTRLQNVRIPFA